MIKYNVSHQNKLSIFKNIFINNGTVTAYYVLFPYNYEVFDLRSAERHINNLYTTISTIYSNMGEMKFSMFKLRNIVSKETTIENIIKTVNIYKKDYSEFPKEYQKYIKNITKDFSILAINIDAKNSIDIENQSIIAIMKQILDSFVKENFTVSHPGVNEDIIRMQNKNFANSLQNSAVPASSQLVMNIFINSVYPSYKLIYDDYIMKNSSSILSSIQQEIIPHLGWFEMSNSGIVAFGGEPRVTYGSILTILELPETINSENFNISMSGLNVNINIPTRQKALLKFKRMRAELEEEEGEAYDANTKDSDASENVSMLDAAIKDIKAGRVMAELDANILVLAENKDELEKKKKNIISILSKKDIVCSISDNQALTYVNSFIKRAPNFSKYIHLMDLQYAISFQLDSGAIAGDSWSEFASPVIGRG